MFKFNIALGKISQPEFVHLQHTTNQKLWKDFYSENLQFASNI